MIQIFLKGGPMMWPLLLTSLVALTVVFERLIFLIRERLNRQPRVVEEIFAAVERGDLEAAETQGAGFARFRGPDAHPRAPAPGRFVFQRASGRGESGVAAIQPGHFSAGYHRHAGAAGRVVWTVTGMIHAFGLLGASELGAPTAITGGIAEALIATAFGLVIAMVALLPFNYLNARLEQARHEIETASAQLEMLLLRNEKNAELVA